MKLYIPHGSDERRETLQSLDKLFRFISHMVQMKAVLPAFSALLLKTLYPTWFR